MQLIVEHNSIIPDPVRLRSLLDLPTPKGIASGNKYIFTVIDDCSRFSFAFPCNNIFFPYEFDILEKIMCGGMAMKFSHDVFNAAITQTFLKRSNTEVMAFFMIIKGLNPTPKWKRFEMYNEGER